MKILVAGGCGFIGSNFVRYALNKKDEVWMVDQLTYAGHMENLNGLNCKFIRMNINDTDGMIQVIQKFAPDVVVNFAAETHVDRSLDGIIAERLFMRANLEGAMSLADACRRTGTYLHHVSTDEVYGDLNEDDPPFTEESPLKPNNPYAVSKAAAEMMLHSYHRAYPRSFFYTISNCTNNYGPYQTPEKLIPRFINNILELEKLPLYTDAKGQVGANIRDWIYVDDHCNAIYTIISHPGVEKLWQKFNIAGSQELRNMQITRKILDAMGHSNYEDWIVPAEDRPGHDYRYALDITKMEKFFGWKPKIKIDRGLPRTVEWYVGAGFSWLQLMNQYAEDVRKDQSKSKGGGKQ